MSKNVWEIIWDYDPNGILVVDNNFNIQIVNSAFLKYFKLENEDIIGRKITDFFDDIQDIIAVSLNEKKVIKKIKNYSEHNLHLSEITFKLEEKNLVAKIFHDVTNEIQRENKINNFKFQILEEVEKIVDKQMKVGQEVASILGETIAETKSSLIKLSDVIKNEANES
ncbi:MAG: hypothetical protein PWP46_684 [Fusobacteriaceae bacterium]|nr:hypothetical protein [Fusobacteriales bacterium]MDN5303805.1 hypothetical protein [Fusobacteriaceae bacterium]